MSQEKGVYACNCSVKSKGWSREEHYHIAACNLSRSKWSVGVCSRCRSESTDPGLEDERAIENHFKSHWWDQRVEPNGGTRRAKRSVRFHRPGGNRQCPCIPFDCYVGFRNYSGTGQCRRRKA